MDGDNHDNYFEQYNDVNELAVENYDIRATGEGFEVVEVEAENEEESQAHANGVMIEGGQPDVDIGNAFDWIGIWIGIWLLWI